MGFSFFKRPSLITSFIIVLFVLTGAVAAYYDLVVGRLVQNLGANTERNFD